MRPSLRRGSSQRAIRSLAVVVGLLAATSADASGRDWHPNFAGSQFPAAGPLASDPITLESSSRWRHDALGAGLASPSNRFAWPGTAASAGDREPDSRTPWRGLASRDGSAAWPSKWAAGGSRDPWRALTDLVGGAAWRALAAQDQGSDKAAGDRTLGDLDPKEASQQSANPVGEFAYIFTQFAAPVFLDGDARGGGDTKAYGQIVFQPIIPIPVYGQGEDEWRIVTRPTIAFNIQQSVPQPAEWNRKTGLTDTLIPLPLALPDRIAGRWLIALGPDFSLPTATHDAFGVQQWTAGVTGVFGYIAENWMAGAYPQFYWRIADQGRNNDVRKARFGNMFYWFWYNLSPTLQIGWSPTIQFNDQARSDDKWNVPVGLYLANLVKFRNNLIRLEVGCDYSVVYEETFGERARCKINMIPVVPRPIRRPLFGGAR